MRLAEMIECYSTQGKASVGLDGDVVGGGGAFVVGGWCARGFPIEGLVLV